MLVVIDTNLWVSGLLLRGMPWRLLRLAERRRVRLCTAPAMVAELAEVLTYERLQPRLQQLGLTPAALIAYVLNVASIFEVPEPEKASIVVADPDDDIFLRCAAASWSKGIVFAGSGSRSHSSALSQRSQCFHAGANSPRAFLSLRLRENSFKPSMILFGSVFLVIDCHLSFAFFLLPTSDGESSLNSFQKSSKIRHFF